MAGSQKSIALYQSVQSSNIAQLARVYNYCRSSNQSISNNSIIECMYFGKENKNPFVDYYNTDNIISTNGVSVWQGIAKYGNQLMIVGTSEPGPNTGQGVIYFGDITGSTGTTNTLSVPLSSLTTAQYSSVYGPRYDSTTGLFTFVGSYTELNDTNIYAFLFRGSLAQLATPSNYVLQMQYSNPDHTTSFTHSTYGNFAVGNSGSASAQDTDSWLYNITTGTYTTISVPGSKTTTTYGIVKNQNGSYTIVGGYSTDKKVSIKDIYKNGIPVPVQYAFAADFTYNGSTVTFSNWTKIQYQNQYLTHFEGISTTSNPNVYSISADVLGLKNDSTGFFLTIERQLDGSFFPSNWVSLDYGKSIGKKGLTTSNSVIDNNIVGLFVGPNGSTAAFQATINL
jgi:hypothetical protein